MSTASERDYVRTWEPKQKASYVLTVVETHNAEQVSICLTTLPDKVMHKVDLSTDEMRRLHVALTRALWERLHK